MTRAEAEALQEEMLMFALDKGEQIRQKRGVVLDQKERIAHLTGIHMGMGAAIAILREQGYLI